MRECSSESKHNIPTYTLSIAVNKQTLITDNFVRIAYFLIWEMVSNDIYQFWLELV